MQVFFRRKANETACKNYFTASPDPCLQKALVNFRLYLLYMLIYLHVILVIERLTHQFLVLNLKVELNGVKLSGKSCIDICNV